MQGEERGLQKQLWAVKPRSAGSRGWLSPAKVPQLLPRAPAQPWALPAPSVPSSHSCQNTCAGKAALSPPACGPAHVAFMPQSLPGTSPAALHLGIPPCSAPARRGLAHWGLCPLLAPLCHLWAWQCQRGAGDSPGLLSTSSVDFPHQLQGPQILPLLPKHQSRSEPCCLGRLSGEPTCY